MDGRMDRWDLRRPPQVFCSCALQPAWQGDSRVSALLLASVPRCPGLHPTLSRPVPTCSWGSDRPFLSLCSRLWSYSSMASKTVGSECPRGVTDAWGRGPPSQARPQQPPLDT
jgi:hypothetical protein